MSEKGIVIILMGSPSDQAHVEPMVEQLDELGIEHITRIASAHKTPSKLLEILQKYENSDTPKVYITAAGRSNALSGMVDAAVSAPVIACPPPSSAFNGADIFSSLRMPSGVAPMVVLEPKNAALAAAKILGVLSPQLQQKIKNLQQENADRLIRADAELNISNE